MLKLLGGLKEDGDEKKKHVGCKSWNINERQSICGAWRKYIKYKVLDKVTRDLE